MVVKLTVQIQVEHTCHQIPLCVAGVKSGAVIRDSASAPLCLLCLSFTGCCRWLAALWPAVWTEAHLCIRHCHPMEGRHWEPPRSRAPRWDWVSLPILFCNCSLTCCLKETGRALRNESEARMKQAEGWKSADSFFKAAIVLHLQDSVF